MRTSALGQPAQTSQADPKPVIAQSLTDAERLDQSVRANIMLSRLTANQDARSSSGAIQYPRIADPWLATSNASQVRSAAQQSALPQQLLLPPAARAEAQQFAFEPARAASPYSYASGIAADDVGLPISYKAAIYDDVGYEQDSIAGVNRKFSEETLGNYIDASRIRAASAMGLNSPDLLNPVDQNRIKYRTAEQLRVGAPIVPYDPTIPALEVHQSPVLQFGSGLIKGFQNQHIVGDYNKWPVNGGKTDASPYSRSYVADKLTGNDSSYLYQDRPVAERVGIELGRMAGDITGNGSRKHFWTLHPEDISNTYGGKALQLYTDINPAIRRSAAWLASNTMGVLSGNYNPLNIEGGGRSAGFQAVTPVEDDLTKSENPVVDMMLYRGMMGRTGKLLPWEEFHVERPDVSYEQYEKYKEYLRDPGMLGMLKGTTEGIDGPEVRMLGYRVTPLGALGAAGVIGGAFALDRGLAASRLRRGIQ